MVNASKEKLNSCDGAWNAQYNGIIIVTSQKLVEFGKFVVTTIAFTMLHLQPHIMCAYM